MKDHTRAVRPKVFKPFPEAIDSGYKVVAGPGAISQSNKVMSVPFDDSDDSRFTRLHEMLHLKFPEAGPPDKLSAKHKVSIESLQCVADARVNTLGEVICGLPMTACGSAEDLEPFRTTLEKMLVDGRRMEAITAATRTRVALEFRSAERLDRMLYDLGLLQTVKPIVQEVVAELEMKRGTISNRCTIQAAKKLDTLLAQYQETQGSPGELGDILQSVQEMKTYAPTKDFYPWGDMTVVTPTLSVRHGAKVSPKFRAADAGDRLGRVSRYYTDGIIFKRKVRQHGGSLLIDGSGSMNLNPADIRAVLDVAPMAWVAIYGGQQTTGQVKILARDGKAVAPGDVYSPGGNNIIDGPALRLLCKQSAPRCWISDGWVTGKGSKKGTGNVADAARICTQGNIRRFEDVPSALAALHALVRSR